jgi:glutaconate CoA-transferase, subunit B
VKATITERMIIASSRRLKDGDVCFVGVGLPSTAANLARLTHAPNICLIYESGPIGAKPKVLPLSIGDGDLAEGADTVVSTPEIFRYWLQAGRIDVGFLGAAQIDRFANINTTVIGPYEAPKTRLPGAGGAPEIASSAKRVLMILRHSLRAFVSKLDFVTSIGFGEGGDHRARLGFPGAGPQAVVTDLCILEPDPFSRELVVTSLQQGVTRETVAAATGWPVLFAESLNTIEPPEEKELAVLRELTQRTMIAHGVAAGDAG